MKNSRPQTFLVFSLSFVSAVAAYPSSVRAEVTRQPGSLYFDPDALAAAPGFFAAAGTSFLLPEILPYEFSAGAAPFKPAASPFGHGNYEISTKEGDDSIGRIPVNGGSFGLETDRKFDPDRKIPSSEMIDGKLDKISKKPFVGLSIVSPYDPETARK